LTDLVLRVNYSDESIALIQAAHERNFIADYSRIWVLTIDTGWAASDWPARVAQGQALAERYGFLPTVLPAKTTFPALVRERNSFPSTKFQWCAGFLKGLPFIDWLDSCDPAGEYTIALPKRAALYRQTIPEFIPECPYHGDRKVWAPLHAVSDHERTQLVARAGFSPLEGASKECSPCVNNTPKAQAALLAADKIKLTELENAIGKKMMLRVVSQEGALMQAFSMGCGDPFGCGL